MRTEIAAYSGSKKAGVVWKYLVSAAMCLQLKDLKAVFHGSKMFRISAFGKRNLTDTVWSITWVDLHI